MTKQCPECKRTLELNNTNFRCSCDGYWRSKCRDCQNKRKRYRYRNKKKVPKPNPADTAKNNRLKKLHAKYSKVFKTLKRLGVSPDAPAQYVDSVLANDGNLNCKFA